MLSQDGLRSDSFRRIYLLMSSLKTKSLDTKESLRTLPNRTGYGEDHLSFRVLLQILLWRLLSSLSV